MSKKTKMLLAVCVCLLIAAQIWYSMRGRYSGNTSSDRSLKTVTQSQTEVQNSPDVSLLDGFDFGKITYFYAHYPDHTFKFTREDPNGEWTAQDIPVQEWSKTDLDRWIADIASLRGIPTDKSDIVNEPTHIFTIGMENGTQTEVLACPDFSEGGMLLWSEPEKVLSLPLWRFEQCFSRHEDLFGTMAPGFPVENIRFIGIMQDGESIKFSHREDGWYTDDTDWTVRQGRLTRVAHFVSNWHSADYADAVVRTGRQMFGSPLLDVTLADGTMHSYRLAGRHPVFAWRYVVVDGQKVFSLTEEDAAALFPRLSDIVDLGYVFHAIEQADVQEISLSSGTVVLFAAERGENSTWICTQGPAKGTPLEKEVADVLVDGPLKWKAEDFSQNSIIDPEKPMFTLRIRTEKDTRTIKAFAPRRQGVPYIGDDGSELLLDRSVFFAWMGAVRELAGRAQQEQAVNE